MMSPVDLRSDTVTRPTAAMREVMATAEVGDDVYDEDPTVNRLQALAAERFGKEAALFVPSGTMANQIALKAQTSPGDAVVIGEGAHNFLFESGAAGLISGVLFDAAGRGGLFTAAEMEAVCHPEAYHYAPTRLVCVECTHNLGGGLVFPLDDIDAIASAAHARGMRVHMDGARLFNAVVASGIPPARWTANVDSVSFCLSKGLGAPVGSMLLGDKDFIRDAHRLRKILGGGMRQAGILAAAGIHALSHHVDRLAEDHKNARLLHAGVEATPSLRTSGEPQTNILRFHTEGPKAQAFVDACATRGILLQALGPDLVRAVTHMDVTREGCERAVSVFGEVAG
jgi:threonine aldolase